MRFSVKATIVGLLAALAALFTATGALAATYNYTLQQTGPDIYQTNYTYTSGSVSSQSGTPSTNVISSVRYNFPSYNPPAGVTINYQICDLQRCVSVGSALSGNSTAFAGDPAVNTFKIKATDSATTTKTLNPALYGKSNYIYVYTS